LNETNETGENMKKLLITLALIASQSGFAATSVWEGPGLLFDANGNPAGHYNVLVERTKSGNQVKSSITVKLPDGTTQQHQCLATESAENRWKSTCDHGKGGGSCFGDGLCISYEEDGNGKSYATTIIFDGPSQMRLLRTELRNGQAFRFFREKLYKR
jgi:hypothetical protein